MSEFEKLVSEQMKIMDQLLELQSELDRCLSRWKRNSSVWKEMQSWTMYRTKLRQSEKTWLSIQELFQRQTEQVIQSYRSTEKPSSYVQK